MDGDGGRIRKFRNNWISISKGFQRARRIGGKVETLVLWNTAAEVATARTTIRRSLESFRVRRDIMLLLERGLYRRGKVLIFLRYEK